VSPSLVWVTYPANIPLGADVIHPAPGSDGRPSFTALVANVDSDTAKYIATSHVQTSRQEMIDDLQEMSKASTDPLVVCRLTMYAACSFYVHELPIEGREESRGGSKTHNILSRLVDFVPNYMLPAQPNFSRRCI